MGLIATVEEGLTAAVTQDASFATAAGWMSLHSGNPGPTGANEVTNGVGAEARQPIAFSGSGGVDTNSGTVTFTVAASTTVLWIGFWDAQTAGTFKGGFPLTALQEVAVGITGGTTIRCPSHGFSPGDTVRAYPIPGLLSSMPAGLTADTQYTVGTVVNADSFTLQPFGGGGDITLTSSGGFSIAHDNFVTTGGSPESLVFPIGTGVVYSTVS